MTELTDKTIEQAQLSETLSRVRRIETRLLKFVSYFGVDPAQDFTHRVASTVFVDAEGTMHCSSPDTTVGVLLSAARKHNLTGDVSVCLFGHHVGTLRVTQ